MYYCCRSFTLVFGQSETSATIILCDSKYNHSSSGVISSPHNQKSQDCIMIFKVNSIAWWMISFIFIKNFVKLYFYGIRKDPPTSSLHWCCLVASSCLPLCNPMEYSPSDSSVHGIFQARIVKWVAIPFSSGFFLLRDPNHASCIAGRFFTTVQSGNQALYLICLK